MAAPGQAASSARPIVPFAAPYPPGSIVIVNSERKLYYVLGKGRALQYPVAVGKPGELWVGRTFVSDKRVSPTWIPVHGGRRIAGGRPDNPLGKRALYLDWSLIRIHGTPSRRSIGSAVSNGCIRMFNEDVIDLYGRVHLGAPIIAVNTRREADQFAAPTVSGKRPAYSAFRFR
jgi:lipoprotein-anchoring transpeptidase ErfK/SrfK